MDIPLKGAPCKGEVQMILDTLSRHSSRSTVMMLLTVMDPVSSWLRKVKRLTRRTYMNKAMISLPPFSYFELHDSLQGTNWCWHIDGYDKLKHFGFPIHACIDG